jgi:hypothetical protein
VRRRGADSLDDGHHVRLRPGEYAERDPGRALTGQIVKKT